MFYCKSTDELVWLLRDTLKTNSEFSLNVSRQVKPDDDLVSSNSADTSSLPSDSRQKKSSLPIKRKLFFACHNLSLSPIRSFFVVLLFAISLFLLMCVLHLSVFNRNTVVADYLEKYQIKCVFPYYLSEYENSYYNRYSKELTGGDYFISQIKQVLPDKEIVRSMALSDWNLSEQDFSAEEIYKRNILQYDINLFVKSSLWSENDLVYGKMPEDKYEIVVSDYLAKELFKSDNALGKHLVFWDNEMKIVGVLKTDYAEYRYKMKKTNNMDFAYTSFLGTHLYEIAIIDESLLDAYENSVNELSILFADFFLSDNDSKYYSYKPLTYVPIGTLKDKEINLIAGREPQAENEIIISENYLFSSNFAAFSDKTDEELFDEILDKEFQFRNNFAENMDYYYTDSLNLYDFVKRVKVVGIVKNSYDDDGLRFDVAIADGIFNKMKSNYFSNFYASQIGVIINSGEERQIVDTIFNNGLRINEPSVRTICSFSDAKDSANSVLMIILFAIMCLTVLVLFSFINYSINSNYRQIGILRAIGTTGKDTLVIFALETGIITLTSLALSFAFDYMIMRYVNKLFMENLPINKFDIIVPNVILCVVTIIITICLALVSAALPIRTLSKKAPIDIIKGA